MEINSRHAGGAVIVTLQGELDAYWAGETERELQSHLERGDHWLVLDLSALSYLSSSGLRVLLRTYQRLAELGGKLALAAPQPYVRDVLSVSGLARALPVYGGLQETLDRLTTEGAGADDAWASASTHVASCGTYQMRSVAGAPSELRVVGEVANLLRSRATVDRLPSLGLLEMGYGLGVGAPAGSAAAAIERLGEMLILPGSVFWLPGDGRQEPDFLTADLDTVRLPVYLLNGLWLQGGPQISGRFTASSGAAGAALDDWAQGVLDLAAQQPTGRTPPAVGVVLRAELAEMWGVALKRVPCADRAPANGQEISHRENIADWLHFPTEPAFANSTLLAAGILAVNSGRPVSGHAWSAIFGTIETGVQAPFRIHLHGAAFRPVPELGGENSLEEEIRHVIRQGELAGVAHLLPTSRLRSALFGVWIL